MLRTVRRQTEYPHRSGSGTASAVAFQEDWVTRVCSGLYGLAWGAALCVSAPYLAARALRHAGEMRERFGLWDELPPDISGALWVHAASLGETRAAIPIISALAAAGVPTAFSVVTPSARGLEMEAQKAGARLVRFAPLDFGPVLRRTISALRPKGLILCETELWPGLLGEAVRRGIPVAFASARLTRGGTRRLRWLRPWLRRILRASFVAAQSPADAERWLELGAVAGRVRVTGNTKYERPRGPLQADERRRARAGWKHVIVLGSVRSAEAEALERALAGASSLHGPTLFVVVPRHPQRADQMVKRLGRTMAVSLERRQAGEPLLPTLERTRRLAAGGPLALQQLRAVLLVRTVGELRRFYELADLAFVGGTLCPIGGHSLFEVAELGVPVLYGPHTVHVEDVAAALEQAGGGHRVSGGDQLGAQIVRLATQAGLLAESSRAAYQAAEELGGAVGRTLDALRAWGFPIPPGPAGVDGEMR